MRLEISAFKSKVGRRIFVLFVSCALVPIVTLGLISFYRVSAQLRTTGRNEISVASRSYGMEILSRLGNLESELELLSSINTSQASSSRFARIRGHWIGVSIIQNEVSLPVWGVAIHAPKLTIEQSRFLLDGGTVLIPSGGGGLSNILLLRYRDVQHPALGLLAGIANRDFLFGRETLSSSRIASVTDTSGQLLFCSEGIELCTPLQRAGTFSGWFRSTVLGNEYESVYHQLFLRAQFRSEPWTIVLSQNAADVLAPMQNFRNTFPLVVLLSLWAVILLSSMQIRRTLVPLERLHHAARRIEHQEFDTQVSINSADEFGELASAFNTMAAHLGEQFKALENLSWGTMKALARAIDAKSAWTAGHSERVTQTALQIGRELSLPPADLVILERGGLLHDIGKIGTPHQILDKAGSLTPEELEIMRGHVIAGVRILDPIPDFQSSLPIVEGHHECFNGTGYPHGLAGEEIDLLARILSVADYYDALVSDRPYREGIPRDEVIQMVKDGAGIRFDPNVVEAFLKVMSCEHEEQIPLQPLPSDECMERG